MIVLGSESYGLGFLVVYIDSSCHVLTISMSVGLLLLLLLVIGCYRSSQVRLLYLFSSDPVLSISILLYQLYVCFDELMSAVACYCYPIYF